MSASSARLATVLAIALYAGCGGSPRSSSTAAEPAAATSTRTATEASEPPPAEEPPEAPPEVGGEPSLASRDDSDWVVVGGFDVTFRLPPGWHRIAAEEIEANREAMLRGDSARLAARGSRQWRRSFQVGATARPISEAVGPVPTVQVVLRTLPRAVSAELLCRATHTQLARSMSGAELVANEPAQLGRLQGHRCAIRYVLSTVAGEAPVEADVYFAQRGTLLLQISFSGPVPLDRAPLEVLLASIRPVE